MNALVLLCTGGKRLGYIRHISYDGKTVLCGIRRDRWEVSNVGTLKEERASAYLCPKCDKQNAHADGRGASPRTVRRDVGGLDSDTKG